MCPTNAPKMCNIQHIATAAQSERRRPKTETQVTFLTFPHGPQDVSPGPFARLHTNMRSVALTSRRCVQHPFASEVSQLVLSMKTRPLLWLHTAVKWTAPRAFARINRIAGV